MARNKLVDMIGKLSEEQVERLSGIAMEYLDLNTEVEDTTPKCCPCCGAAFSDIAETGKVGCSECYKTFYTELLPYLKRIHGGVRHTGKVPGTKQLVIKEETGSVSELKAKLASLVAAEKYEEAAVVRDEIKKMEGK